MAFPDILSRSVTVEEYQKHQLKHRKKPRDIEFYDEHGSPVIYNNTMTTLTTFATTFTHSIANKETIIKFSACRMMVTTSH